MKVLVNIDQRGALAAGIDAPHSTQTIELDPALIPEDVRGIFSEQYDFKTGDVSIRTYNWAGDAEFRFGVSLIPPITPERFIAAWTIGARQLLESRAVLAQRKAEKESAERALDAEARRQFIAGEIGGRDELAPFGDSKGTCFSQLYHDTSIYDTFVYVKGNRRLELGPDLEPAIAAYREREAAYRAEVSRLAEAKKAEQEAQRQRTVACLDDEEKAMHERGYLDLKTVERRLDDEAIAALRAKIEPPEYEVRVVTDPYRDRKPSNREEFRLLRRIEQLAGITTRLVFVPWSGYEDAGVEIKTTTADGRELLLVVGVVKD